MHLLCFPYVPPYIWHHSVVTVAICPYNPLKESLQKDNAVVYGPLCAVFHLFVLGSSPDRSFFFPGIIGVQTSYPSSMIEEFNNVQSMCVLGRNMF